MRKNLFIYAAACLMAFTLTINPASADMWGRSSDDQKQSTQNKGRPNNGGQDDRAGITKDRSSKGQDDSQGGSCPTMKNNKRALYR